MSLYAPLVAQQLLVVEVAVPAFLSYLFYRLVAAVERAAAAE